MGSYEPVDSPDETTIFPYHDLEPPTTADVYRAARVVRNHLPRTPLVRSESLSEELDANVYLKREDTLPTGAFKVRGGIYLAHDLPDEFRDPGMIAASTGNHGQSIAYAGREFGVPVVVGVPEDANPSKVAAMRRFGARVEHHGADFDEAREWVEHEAAREGYRYVHSANEPRLIADVGTAGLEVVEDLPEVDVVINPMGGGSSAAGYCLSTGAVADATIVGVQSGRADALYRAWTEGHLDPAGRMETFAEGLATRIPFALTMSILRERLDEMILVDDDDLRAGIRRLLHDDHVLAEGAAAAGVAAALQLCERLAGKTVVLVVSGGNLSLPKLRRVLADDAA
jgi:threonine dehydratase